MKKISIAFCLFLISFSLSAQLLGDVDENGIINMIDSLLIAQYYVHIYNNKFNPDLADVNCNNLINIVDALLVAQRYVELIPDFSCPTPIPTPTPTVTPIPTDIPTPVPTLEPTDLPGTGEVRLIPVTSNVNSGDLFTTAIDINAGFHEYANYEFAIYFDSSIIKVNTTIGSAGVTIGTNGFISSVDASSTGAIRIIGDRSTGIPSSGENLYINWIASLENGGGTMLDLIVYTLADENYDTIGFPEGFPGYVNVVYTTPAPTPTPTAIPTATPAPDITPDITAAPVNTPEPTIQPATEPGLVFFQPESFTVNGGDFFTTPLRIDTAPYYYGYYEFTIYYNNAYITIDTSQGNNGVTPGINGFVTSVENSPGIIRIIGDGLSFPGTGEDDNLIIHWIAEYFISGTITLDLNVYDLRDIDGYIIGNPRGNDGTIEVIYVEAPTDPPTPEPTRPPLLTETPGNILTIAPTIAPTPTPVPENMTADIELPTSVSWGGINHWIPNTGEDFGPFRVKITAENPNGGNFAFIDDFESLDILSPLDDNFDSGETGDSNIKTNKGTCQYYVYARQTNQNPVVIKIYELNSSIMNSAERYRTVFSATGANLKVGVDGYLYYDNNGTIYNYFTVKVQDGIGIIRPGDDLRFRFGVVYYPEFNATVSAGDFMAVYDKKLLWRANLYVDERPRNGDGELVDINGNVVTANTAQNLLPIVDWNDVNFWSNAENTWQNNTSYVAGGQIDIRPFTHYIDNRSYFDTLPYTQACADSIEHFNLDMDSQATTLTAQGQDANRKNPTLAPEIDNLRNWDNYAFGTQIGEDIARTYSPLIINNVTYHPYTPGFATASDPYCSILTGYSAGVNCYGFLQRSMAYDGNKYAIDEVGGRLLWGGTTQNLAGWTIWQNNSWDFLQQFPATLIPGDIMIMENHVAIVVGIIYSNNERIVTSANTDIIDANGVTWKVEKRSWSVIPSLEVYRPIYE